jgi:competence protein ComEA
MLKIVFGLVAALCATISLAAVDVNRANAAELDSIKGVGPALSGKILDERKNGAFKDWNDLISRVKGMGPKNAVKLSSEGLTVNNAGYREAAVAPATDAGKK